jgi:solute carrier family 25 carnitine/acylcarnitine transporter 20/29
MASDERATPVVRWYESTIARELLAGTIGGCAGILVSQPFDVIKVRLQAGSAVKLVDPAGTALSGGRVAVPSVGIARNLIEGWKREGALSLYRGIGPPLLANGAINAVLFSTYGAGLRWRGVESPEAATPADAFVAGTYAGLCTTAISIPTELIKIRQQAEVSLRLWACSQCAPGSCLHARDRS